MFTVGKTIPFNLFGTSWTIKFVKKTESQGRDKHWIFGNSSLLEKTIKVSVKDREGKDVDAESIQITALHELVHSIFTTGQYLDETKNEALVEWTARSIYNLYKQEVLQKIMKENDNNGRK